MATPDPSPSVQSVEEYLRETYAWLVEVDGEIHDADRRLHEFRDRLRARLYALKVAKNPEIRSRLDRIREHAEAGKPFEDAMTGDELAALIRDGLG